MPAHRRTSRDLARGLTDYPRQQQEHRGKLALGHQPGRIILPQPAEMQHHPAKATRQIPVPMPAANRRLAPSPGSAALRQAAHKHPHRSPSIARPGTARRSAGPRPVTDTATNGTSRRPCTIADMKDQTITPSRVTDNRAGCQLTPRTSGISTAVANRLRQRPAQPAAGRPIVEPRPLGEQTAGAPQPRRGPDQPPAPPTRGQAALCHIRCGATHC